MKNLICIVCPKGCHLCVDDENGYTVTGNSCPRGAEYGKTELIDPRRIITSTVRITAKTARRVPVNREEHPEGQDYGCHAGTGKHRCQGTGICGRCCLKGCRRSRCKHCCDKIGGAINKAKYRIQNRHIAVSADVERRSAVTRIGIA